MTLVLVFLGLAVMGGLTLLTLRLKTGANPPLVFAALHGTAAAAALVSLVVTVVSRGAGGFLLISLVLLGTGALVGFYMLSLHVRGRLIPVRLVLMHGLTQFMGVLFFLAAYFG